MILRAPIPARGGLTRRRLIALGLTACAGALAAAASDPATAALKLDVTQGNVQPLPIALPDFIADTQGDAEMARGVSQIIAANLRRSGLFAPIDPAAFIEKIGNVNAVPRFEDWRAINAQALVTG